ncbi:MAG: adenylate/guanylate cyclase domain-containing protein, partial [Chloroflexota bacterium]
AYAPALAQHHRLMRRAIGENGGTEVKTEGDSFFVIFPDASAGTRAAVEAQRLIAAAEWPQGEKLVVRMGLHSGDVALSEGEYVGVELHRAARIASTAHGGQIIVSAGLRDGLNGDLPDGVSLRDAGEHRLKDFDEPVHLYQVDIAGLRTEFPPLTSISARFEILPPELSTFVGRDDEVSEVSELLSGSRLLTMTGPGGTGKTRLALQAARHCEQSFAQGVAFVPLAPINDPQLVSSTIRGTLGFSEEPGESSIQTLTSRLRHHEMLLILDNFEQVMPASESVGALLEGTEHLTVMVTSRASLHLEGEQEYSVPPLGVPDLSGVVDVDQVARSEAVGLFVDRARKSRTGFALDDANARDVALICQRLDGLPLAIELAASRIKLLSPGQLLARLNKRMDFLGSTAAGRQDRRRTLRGTIDWSHDLLSPPERITFRRLAVFVGGASLEAIEAIVPAPAGADDDAEVDVLETLGQLVDNSLVRSVEAGGVPRFLMLETIREYGLERMADASELEVLAEAHARHYLGRAVALSPRFTSDPETLDEVEADHDNVRAALRWAMDHEHTAMALEAAGALWRFWHLRGHLHEGLVVCDEVLAMPGATTASEAGASALYARASLLYWQGSATAAHSGYVASLEMARSSGARAREAEAQFALAYSYMIAKDWDAAHEAARAATLLYDEQGDRLGSANARFADAYASSLGGDWAIAAKGFEAVLGDIEATGDRFWTISSQVTLAWTLIQLERLAEARDILRASIGGAIDLGDRSMEHMSVVGLAMVAAREGDVERALRLAGAGTAMAEELGGKAPDELVIGLDPVTSARDSGTPEADITRLTSEGRLLAPDEVRSLARGV